MKFTKFGKALLTGVLSAGAIFGVSSCVQSYTVGYLYVTGTVTNKPTSNGVISGFRIDHNTGQLRMINTLPIASAGANPVRAVLTNGSRFLYVLNRGVNAAGDGNCTTADPCQGSNITQFTVGGNGSLSFQQTFFTQGINPFRMALDSTGNFLLVLDHDAPDSNALTGKSATSNSCTEMLGSATTSCGDVTVFQIDQTTGRLSLIQNAQATAAGTQLSFFPVPPNPVDFLLSGGFLLTLTSGSPQASFPYTGGSQVFPYGYSSTSGQLTLSQNTAQTLGIHEGNAIVSAASVIYVLDNESITVTANGSSMTVNSQILPFTLGTNGALQAQTGGVIPGSQTSSNPIYLISESKGTFIYVANQGSNTTGQNPQSTITGYVLHTSPSFQLVYNADFGTGSNPQCLVEDPSSQFIYTANQGDSTVTGRVVDPNSGVLNPLRVASTYSLQGPASWCLMDGRTN